MNPIARKRNTSVMKTGRYGISAFTELEVAPAPTPRTPKITGPAQHKEDRKAESSEPMAVTLTFTLFTPVPSWISG